MNDYKELRKEIKKKCASEDFENVNKCIENRLSGKSESEQLNKIKSLICYIEGKLNKMVFYSIAAISYALEIGAVTVLCNLDDVSNIQKVGFAILMFVIAIALIIVGMLYSINDQKDTFILKALNFKLDELSSKNESSKETGETNESDIKNGANTANEQDGKMNCKKYVVRVYDK